METQLSGPSSQRKLDELNGSIGVLARCLEVATIFDVATRFNLDLAIISRAVRKIEEGRLESKELQERIEVVSD